METREWLRIQPANGDTDFVFKKQTVIPGARGVLGGLSVLTASDVLPRFGLVSVLPGS